MILQPKRPILLGNLHMQSVIKVTSGLLLGLLPACRIQVTMLLQCAGVVLLWVDGCQEYQQGQNVKQCFISRQSRPWAESPSNDEVSDGPRRR